MSAALFADWPAPPGVVAFTTLRHGPGVSQAPFDAFNLGARCGDEAAAVYANRERLIDEFSLPAAPYWLRQVHGTQAVRVTQLHPGAEEPEADAAIASDAGTVLAILTADCLPVVFATADGEIAAAHAGWRGLAAGVLENTVAALPAPAGRVLAWLGPAAGPQAYEVGEEVFDAFVSRDARAQPAFAATRPGHWRVDLYALASQRLRDAGVEQVYGGGLCTISDPKRFYSHRRDQRTGRMATVVYRKP